jgi:hypothetical protein
MSPRLPALGSSITGLALMAAASAQTAPEVTRSEGARAQERCEASAAQTLQTLRGKRAQDVQFLPAQRVVAAIDDTEISVKGAGRYGAGAAFSFSCSFNAKTGVTSGVVLRETGAASARPEADWQPDLSHVSPQVCESAAAQLLKEKHPRVAQIVMEPDTRRLEPGADGNIVLLGQGGVQRAPGMNAVPFTYACEFDGRSGALVGVKTSV